ncbi:unnamed protein product [Nesidiocoris tenuis]|uniref:Uncharacterized protein n=1 Tax=Nesidiocoris tenuis TaxID=355587 RepID=A0A6H5HMC9_9HEMI|nr:unnamed protein product [Nesidiocoris tenuis]
MIKFKPKLMLVNRTQTKNETETHYQTKTGSRTRTENKTEIRTQTHARPLRESVFGQCQAKSHCRFHTIRSCQRSLSEGEVTASLRAEVAEISLDVGCYSISLAPCDPRLDPRPFLPSYLIFRVSGRRKQAVVLYEPPMNEENHAIVPLLLFDRAVDGIGNEAILFWRGFHHCQNAGATAFWKRIVFLFVIILTERGAFLI